MAYVQIQIHIQIQMAFKRHNDQNNIIAWGGEREGVEQEKGHRGGRSNELGGLFWIKEKCIKWIYKSTLSHLRHTSCVYGCSM